MSVSYGGLQVREEDEHGVELWRITGHEEDRGGG